MAEKLKYIRNSWAAFNKGSLMKSSACGAGGVSVVPAAFSDVCGVS